MRSIRIYNYRPIPEAVSPLSRPRYFRFASGSRSGITAFNNRVALRHSLDTLRDGLAGTRQAYGKSMPKLDSIKDSNPQAMND